MESLKLVVGWAVALFVLLLGLIILLQIAAGKINLEKLVSEENGDASMSRFQLLIFTFVIAMSLFLVIISNSPVSFPNSIPTDILALLGISGGSYLVSKGIQASKETAVAQSTSAAAPPQPQGTQVLSAGAMPAAANQPQPPVAPAAASPDDGSVG